MVLLTGRNTVQQVFKPRLISLCPLQLEVVTQ